jgi:hypothetical protein
LTLSIRYQYLKALEKLKWKTKTYKNEPKIVKTE